MRPSMVKFLFAVAGKKSKKQARLVNAKLATPEKNQMNNIITIIANTEKHCVRRNTARTGNTISTTVTIQPNETHIKRTMGVTPSGDFSKPSGPSFVCNWNNSTSETERSVAASRV